MPTFKMGHLIYNENKQFKVYHSKSIPIKKWDRFFLIISRGTSVPIVSPYGEGYKMVPPNPCGQNFIKTWSQNERDKRNHRTISV
jgi:hypothetical protein